MSSKFEDEVKLNHPKEAKSKKDLELRVHFKDLDNPYNENEIRILSGNKLNPRQKEVYKRNIKNKNNTILIFLITITILFPSYNKYINLQLHFSNITLKIKGIGNKNVFCNKTGLFRSKYYPNEIYINRKGPNIVNNTYFLNQTDNYVNLIWHQNIDNCGSMFSGCQDIEEIDLSRFNSSQVTNMGDMFMSCSSLTSINLSNLITSGVINMNGMFRDCSSLKELNLSSFQTSSVTNMGSMFSGCSSLSSLNLSNFDTSHVSIMNNMFSDCSLLSSLNLSNFDTSQVTTMSNMFSGCSSLILLDLSNFDTSKVELMISMFSGCSLLSSFNLSNFDTSKVSRMDYMFCNCSSLTSLNISNFEIKKVRHISGLFLGCILLEYINIKKFKASEQLSNANDMFKKVPDNAVVCILENDDKDKIVSQIKGKTCHIIDCSDDWRSKQNVLINNSYMCFKDNEISEFKLSSSCEKITDKQLCEKCGNSFLPIENNFSNNEETIMCYSEIPKGYYLDKNDSFYKKCYYSCKTCENKGDNITHNCLKCSNDFPYKIYINDYINCYNICPYYHYIDNENVYHCTYNLSCPYNYPIFIPDKNECTKDNEIDTFKTDNEIIISSEYSIIDSTKQEIKENTKSNNYNYNTEIPLKIEDKTQNFISNIYTLEEIQNKINAELNISSKLSKEEQILYYNEILSNIESVITSNNFDTFLLDNGEDKLISMDKMLITLTTTSNINTNLNNNITLVHLAECEKALRNYYNISEKENLYLKKIDIIQQGMNTMFILNYLVKI